MTKEESLLAGLLIGERHTTLTALSKYRTTCLCQRVSEWRRAGYAIKDRFVPGTKYKEYWMEQAA